MSKNSNGETQLLKPILPGFNVNMNQIITAVGDAHVGDVIAFPIPYHERIAVTRRTLYRTYPASQFKIMPIYRGDELHAEVEVLKPNNQ